MDSISSSLDLPSSDTKTAILRQIQQENAVNNARQLISVRSILGIHVLLSAHSTA